MATPPDGINLNIQSQLREDQRDRADERERIAALYEIRKNKKLGPELAALFDPNEKPEDIQWHKLVMEGFLYTLEELTKKRVKFEAKLPKTTPPAQIDYADQDVQQAFFNFLYEQELQDYINNHKSDKETGHRALYIDLLALSKLDKDPDQTNATVFKTERNIDARMQDHQANARARELSTRAHFMQKNDIQPPAAFIAKADAFGYENWDGKQPLPDVNLKKASPSVATISIADLGVNLKQLHEIMSEPSGNIELAGVACNGRKNPFREIVFKFGDPKEEEYTLIAVFEKDATGKISFMVKPCLLSDMQAGKPKDAKIDGWMAGGKVTSPADPAGMSVADAQADALLKLAKFSFVSAPPVEPVPEPPEEEVHEAMSEVVPIEQHAVETTEQGQQAVLRDFQPPEDPKRLNQTDLETFKRMLRLDDKSREMAFIGEAPDGKDKAFYTANVVNAFSRYGDARIEKPDGSRSTPSELSENGAISLEKLEANGFDNRYFLSDEELIKRGMESKVKHHDQDFVPYLRTQIKAFREKYPDLVAEDDQLAANPEQSAAVEPSASEIENNPSPVQTVEPVIGLEPPVLKDDEWENTDESPPLNVLQEQLRQELEKRKQPEVKDLTPEEVINALIDPSENETLLANLEQELEMGFHEPEEGSNPSKLFVGMIKDKDLPSVLRSLEKYQRDDTPLIKGVIDTIRADPRLETIKQQEKSTLSSNTRTGEGSSALLDDIHRGIQLKPVGEKVLAKSPLRDPQQNLYENMLARMPQKQEKDSDNSSQDGWDDKHDPQKP